MGAHHKAGRHEGGARLLKSRSVAPGDGASAEVLGPRNSPVERVVRVVRVLPQEPAIDKLFDYTVPSDLVGAELIAPGTQVRIELNGRRIGAWVIEVDVEVDPTSELFAKLRPIAKVRGLGPPAPVVELSRWAAWRWAGRWASVLRFADPPNAVRSLARAPVSDAAALVRAADTAAAQSSPSRLVDADAVAAEVALLAVRAFAASETTVVRLPPACDPFPLVLQGARAGGERGALVIAPSTSAATALFRRLRAVGVPVALLPDDWARAAAGGVVVVGARAAVWAPIAEPGAIVVLDEHDESHQDERTPTWHVRDVAVERAKRLGVPCVLVSSMPSLEALETTLRPVLTLSRKSERAGWPMLQVIDRSVEEPGRQGLLSAQLAPVLRSEGRVVCVLNRVGRARLLGCVGCGSVLRCDPCGATMHQPTEEPQLVCARCAMTRPIVCDRCGAGRVKNIRMGVSRAREEIEALALRPVTEIVGATPAGSVPRDGVVVGTEAVLHRVGRADAVVLLDFDAELLAPRYRAAEQALALLARAGRLVGGRGHGGSVFVQTRIPDHEVLQAVMHADPDLVMAVELERRQLLSLPPVTAIVSISGPAASEFAASLRAVAADERSIEVGSEAGGTYLVRAPDHDTLNAALQRAPRPAGRVRVCVDPLRF